jgi:YidC/Oxa1 family membrane protein insertase
MIASDDQDYRYYYKGDSRSYQAGLIDDGVLNRGDVVFSYQMYIGPKSISLLRTLNLDLERSVDFGYFAFIAKPMHDFMMWMNGYVHNFGWCIILLVITIKIIFFYPTHKAYESMASMRKIQPEMMRLKDLYGEDRQKMGQEMMKLYKKHKVNPMGGCFPILIQIPVFFALYKVLLMSIEMRQAPFIGWIHDLSVQDPYFVLPVLMGLSMFIQQRLNPQPTDPMQAKVLQFLPPVFTIMFLFFPAGLVLYWLVNNILSIGQQWYVLRIKNAL